MTGTNARFKKVPPIVLQPRDKRLLTELGTMRVIDREQAKIVAGFQSTTRANVRLLALVRTGFLKRFFIGTIAGGRRAIYTLSSKGAGQVDSPLPGIHRPTGVTLAGDRFLEHQLQLNTVYLVVRFQPIPIPGARLTRWITFQNRFSATAPIVPDAYVEVESGGGVYPMFVEVDLGTEPLRRWRQKSQSYLQLAISGEFQRQFNRSRFRVLVIAHSERRTRTVRAEVSRLTEKIFWFSTLPNIHTQGFWSAVWLRPHGQIRQALL